MLRVAASSVGRFATGARAAVTVAPFSSAASVPLYTVVDEAAPPAWSWLLDTSRTHADAFYRDAVSARIPTAALRRAAEKGMVTAGFPVPTDPLPLVDAVAMAFFGSSRFAPEGVLLRVLGAPTTPPAGSAFGLRFQEGDAYVGFRVLHKDERQVLLQGGAPAVEAGTRTWLGMEEEGDVTTVFFGSALVTSAMPPGSLARTLAEALVPVHVAYAHFLLTGLCNEAAAADEAAPAR